ncbi:MAG: hypothetical protein KJO35_08360, partial [Gammaproteobacteria bacterium]|nr:hypothetical protein [Gammaproteobacteria bacterium]
GGIVAAAVRIRVLPIWSTAVAKSVRDGAWPLGKTVPELWHSPQMLTAVLNKRALTPSVPSQVTVA